MKNSKLLHEKNLNKSPFNDFYQGQLFKFSKFETAQNNIKDIIDHRAVEFDSDLYGNTKAFGLKRIKTENRFNLLNYFKPGDLLSSVIAQE